MNHAKSLVSTVDHTPDGASFHGLGTTPEGPKYHPGLNITLNKEMIERLGLPDDPQKGDECHICCHCVVKEIHDDAGGKRLHLQITDCGVPEEPDEDDEDRGERFYDKVDSDMGDYG